MICPAYHLVSWPTLPEDAQGQEEEKNSELLDTSKNSFLYDDCLLINKIAIWKSSGIAFLIHWATLASKTALVSDAYAGLVSRDRSSVKKLRFLNLLNLSILRRYQRRTRDVAQAQKTNFPTCLPRPLRDHDIHLPLQMINSCL